MLLDRRVDGLIILANWLFVDINLLADLERNGVPTAMISRELKSDSISSVILDNEAGGRMAMEHLVSLGHKKIAVFRGPKLLGDSAPRWRGMKRVAQAAGVVLDEKLMVDLPDSRNPLSSFEAGLHLTEELLRQRKAFTALIAFDDLTAFGAIRALEKNGLRVPADCSPVRFLQSRPHHHPPTHAGHGCRRGKRFTGVNHRRSGQPPRHRRPPAHDARTHRPRLHPRRPLNSKEPWSSRLLDLSFLLFIDPPPIWICPSGYCPPRYWFVIPTEGRDLHLGWHRLLGGAALQRCNSSQAGGGFSR